MISSCCDEWPLLPLWLVGDDDGDEEEFGPSAVSPEKVFLVQPDRQEVDIIIIELVRYIAVGVEVGRESSFLLLVCYIFFIINKTKYDLGLEQKIDITGSFSSLYPTLVARSPIERSAVRKKQQARLP